MLRFEQFGHSVEFIKRSGDQDQSLQRHEPGRFESLDGGFGNPRLFCERLASVLKGARVVFNIGGNKYRVILAIDYQRQLGFIRFVGTNAQYDQINAETV
ncbi:HigB_toxin, RelE-like toxic component of a toxin-antitoxin system [Pseudomonas moraviensis]|nr:HigB_toxin, RelE-like toxic component of a toxin-antitoxin system [Pseudomonas moraviensis]